ncbi:FecR family protein [Synoicihabitans lomoniglobus]|uniref:FecR domain-containing protein n=1 Tax=Synoicihabitans lomoniglobus TaxID=2909285 RepID=A0AAF0CSX7_9BACT|nr:FecR domain-containing protein [Opitutaceae bacterium LMO-M01]WED67487.1 FecR domain-containing protein [Opitutaceae bacterium LMO-M01]
MNTNPSPSDSSIEEAASLWAARLEGDGMSAADRTAFEAWLEADSRHRETLAEYCQISSDLEQQLPALVAAGNVTMPAVDPDPVRRSWRTGALGWLTAGLVAAAAAITIIATTGTADAVGPQSIATPIAQRQTVTLEDGTVVDLNAHTNIVVEQTKHERRVRLATGQAFFQVTKDASRPFIVETPAGAVRVTGTAFDVRTAPDGEIEVTVLEGSVQVHLGENNSRPATTPYVLRAGDQLTSQVGVPVRRHLTTADILDVLAWREGEIVSTNISLRELLARFAYYHGRGISAAPEVSNEPFAGRYGLDDLEVFFEDLELLRPVNVIHDPSGTYRVVPRN